MPKRITHLIDGKQTMRMNLSIQVSLDDIKVVLIEVLHHELSGSTNASVVRDYALVLTRKRVEDKVSNWLIKHGTQSLTREQQYLSEEERLLYLNSIDTIVNRLYPELL